MKDKLRLYSFSLGKRFTKKQKTRFLNQYISDFQALGYKAEIMECQTKSIKNRNVIIGDLNKADKVIITTYDTPSRYILPCLNYYPFNQVKNQKNDLCNTIMRLVSLVFCVVVLYIIYILWKNMGLSFQIISFVILLFMTNYLIYLFMGFPNQININRNTASLIINLEIAQCVRDNSVAFILLDNSSEAWQGISMIPKELIENKIIIYLDCIGKGDTLLFAYTESESEKLSAFKANNQKSTIYFKEYSDKKRMTNILRHFSHAVYISNGTIVNQDFVVKDTRSNRDTYINLQNLSYIKKLIIELMGGNDNEIVSSIR